MRRGLSLSASIQAARHTDRLPDSLGSGSLVVPFNYPNLFLTLHCICICICSTPPRLHSVASVCMYYRAIKVSRYFPRSLHSHISFFFVHIIPPGVSLSVRPSVRTMNLGFVGSCTNTRASHAKETKRLSGDRQSCRFRHCLDAAVRPRS